MPPISTAIEKSAVTNHLVAGQVDRKSVERYLPFAATITDQGLVSFANFTATVLIGRALGPYALGVFTLLWSIPLFLNVVQQSFLIAPMLTLRSKVQPEDQASYLLGVGKLQLICAGVAPLVLILTLLYLRLFRIEVTVIQHYGIPVTFACVAFQFQEF